MENLTGRLLVAVPRAPEQAEDGGIVEVIDLEADSSDVFDRSVVLVLHHDDEGAHGLVLNRPLTARVDAVLPTWQDHVALPQRLFQGGPVQLDSALGLVSVLRQDSTLGVKLLFGSVGLIDLDAPPEVVMPEVDALRIFAGYAGWTSGQVEREIMDGSWFVVDAQDQDVFSDDPSGLWQQVLRRQGGTVAYVASFPQDPSQN
ncbi:YqgE/AlgH family protein [Dermacoccaceae bacterium W4C1]